MYPALAQARDLAARAPSMLPGSGRSTREPGLTPRELEILRLVASGKSNAEIACELVISIRTAERHLANIYSKLGTSGAVARAMATADAHRRGVVADDLPDSQSSYVP